MHGRGVVSSCDGLVTAATRVCWSGDSHLPPSLLLSCAPALLVGTKPGRTAPTPLKDVGGFIQVKYASWHLSCSASESSDLESSSSIAKPKIERWTPDRIWEAVEGGNGQDVSMMGLYRMQTKSMVVSHVKRSNNWCVLHHGHLRSNGDLTCSIPNRASCVFVSWSRHSATSMP